jgi:hypothetical protein
MTTPAQQLLDDYSQHDWQVPRLYERLFDLAETPPELFRFLLGFVQTQTKSTPIFDDGLSHITREELAELVAVALDVLQTQENKNAERVIEHASLQFPELLHGRLDDIFRLGLAGATGNDGDPWRNLDTAGIAVWQARLLAATGVEEQERLVRCLFATRNPKAMAFAFDHAVKKQIFPPARWPRQWQRPGIEEYHEQCLESSGHVRRNGVVESYCPNPVMHLRFPAGYLGRQRIQVRKHPTWHLPAAGITCRFGGALDGNAAHPFSRVITFDGIPPGIRITGLRKLTLGCHVAETMEGPLFYRHDASGDPGRLNTLPGPDDAPGGSDAPITETQVELTLTPPRWRFQSWGASNSRQNLFRIGGEPAWIQGAWVPACPCCGAKMDFLMQLDSDNNDGSGSGGLFFGSGGCCYIFWCDACKVSGYVMQCT